MNIHDPAWYKQISSHKSDFHNHACFLKIVRNPRSVDVKILPTLGFQWCMQGDKSKHIIEELKQTRSESQSSIEF